MIKIDAPIVEGKTSATSETTMVSPASPRLGNAKFLRDGPSMETRSPMDGQKLEVLALLGANPFTCWGIAES